MLRHPALLLLACLCLPAGAAAALRHGIESPGRFWTLRQLRLTQEPAAWSLNASPPLLPPRSLPA